MELKSKSPNNFANIIHASRGVSAWIGHYFKLALYSALLTTSLLTTANGQGHGPAVELDPSRPLLSKDRASDTLRPSDRMQNNPYSPSTSSQNPPLSNATPPSPPERPDQPGPPSQPFFPPSPFKSINSGVESGDLAPITDNEGSGLPIGVWQGLDAATLEKLFANIDLPPRSPTLNKLWLRFLTSNASFGANKAGVELKVLRLEALYRSGHFAKILALPEERAGRAIADQAGRHMVEFIKAKAELGLGQTKQACQRLKNAGPAGTGMPKGLAVQLLKMTIYCRAAGGDIPGANLVVDLAREQGIGSTYASKAVYALESKRKNAPKIPKKLDLIDFSFTSLFQTAHLGDLINNASAPVLAAMLNDQRQPAPAKLRIAERAFKLNIVEPKKMAEIYGQMPFPANQLNNPVAAMGRYKNQPEGRALLYRAVEYERNPVKRAQLARHLMASAKTAGLYGHIARLLSGTVERMPQTPDLAWFSETAIEILLASGEFEKALSWAVFGSADLAAGPRNLLNWLTLIDIGAPEDVVPNGAGLVTTEQAALSGQFSPDTLHRLVTVLDALKYNVPIRLWNRASSAPQPRGGFLPQTGVLSQLETAARNQQFGKIILYSMIALGRDGPQGAHMIALGDTIKAMSKGGMKNEARNIALEALYSAWPRVERNRLGGVSLAR